MNPRNLFAVVLVICSLSPALAEEFSSSTAQNGANTIRLSPDAAEIARLVQSRTSKDLILSTIKSTPRPYELSAADALAMQRVGVSSEIITAMIRHDEALGKQEFHEQPRPTEPVPLYQMQDRSQTQSPAKAAVPTTTVTTNNLTRSAMTNSAGKVAPASKPKSGSTSAVTALSAKPKVTSTRSIIVEQAPPPPKLELVPEAPDRNSIWIPGHWTWEQARWVWIPGEWVFRPASDLVWFNGFWAKHGKGYIWIPGSWRTYAGAKP